MGLSKEERLGKMVWAVHALTRLGRELQAQRAAAMYLDGLPVLIELLDRLWHAYLGGRSNGMYWLVGGDLDGPVTEEGLPWSSIVMAQCEEARLPPDEPGEAHPFDPFRDMLSVKGLLPDDAHQKVYDVYGWTEQLAYALRRYPDELMAQYAVLDKLISDIQGACFHIFQSSTAYGRAYVGNRLLQALYDDTRVEEVFNELHLQVLLRKRIRSCTLAEVIAWDRWRLDHQMTLHNRVLLAIRICGPGFNEFHFRKLMARVRGSVCEPVLQRELAKCLELQAAEREWAGKYSVSVDAPDAAVHGYDIYRVLRDARARAGKEGA